MKPHNPALVAAFAHNVPVFQGLYGELASRTSLTTIEPRWRWQMPPLDNPGLVPGLHLPMGGPGQWLRGGRLRTLAQQAGTVVLTRPHQMAWMPLLEGVDIVYHAVDDYMAYNRANAAWEAKEVALLRRARHVFAVSDGLADVLAQRGGIERSRITTLSNAVARAWVPAQLPAARPLAGRRPLAGTLGVISRRLRLDWLAQAVEATPWLDWVFAGGLETARLEDADHRTLKAMARQPNCRFTGKQTYQQLEDLARTLDVALMPYAPVDVNPLGSPVRLFMHLPTGVPILSTPGCQQTDQFAPLVTRCDSAQSLVQRLEWLRARGFDDGLREQRWITAHHHTWDVRANTMLAALGR